jgi:hypothetical protein
MAEYLVLVYEDEQRWARADAETGGRIMAAHGSFAAANHEALRGGNALEPTSTATSIRRGPTGEFLVTDGAFAETKEALGGYYVIEAPDLDAALEIAKQVPSEFGGLEVRPIRPM